MDWQTLASPEAGDADDMPNLTHTTSLALLSCEAAEQASMGLSPPLPDSPTVNCQLA